MLKKYAIVNDLDRPESRLVTQIINSKHYYMMRSIEEDMKKYDGMNSIRPAFLEDFGFQIIERENQVDFKLVNDSRATYKSGEIRFWQGEKEFSLPKVIFRKLNGEV